MSRSRAVRTHSVLCALALLVACGGDGDSASERAFLSIGTAPPGGAFFPVGGAIAEVLDARGEAEGWRASAEATKGTQENIRRLARGELDLGMANAAITYFAARGVGDWEDPQDVRAVVTLAPNVALFVAPASGPVRTIPDLVGKRVVVGPAGAGFDAFVGPIVEAHGVALDDFTVLNGTQSQAVDLLSDGAAAAAFLGGAVPTASITQYASSNDARYVPFDPAAREALIENYPFFRPATIPAGTYRGLESDFDGLDVGSMHLITSASADEDRVYRITKAIWEGREAIARKHPAGRAINERNAARHTGVDFHPGAERFWREIGVWPADDAPGPTGANGSSDSAGGD